MMTMLSAHTNTNAMAEQIQYAMGPGRTGAISGGHASFGLLLFAGRFETKCLSAADETLNRVRCESSAASSAPSQSVATMLAANAARARMAPSGPESVWFDRGCCDIGFPLVSG